MTEIYIRDGKINNFTTIHAKTLTNNNIKPEF